MENDQWNDPLLITDVCTQQQEELKSQAHCQIQEPLTNWYSPRISIMTQADLDHLSPNSIQEFSLQNGSLEGSCAENSCEQIAAESVLDGRNMLEFSFMPLDLVICDGSPDIPRKIYEDSPEFLKRTPTVISLDNGIEGSETRDFPETKKAAEFLTFLGATTEHDASQEAYLELPPPPPTQEESSEHTMPLMSINAGSEDVTFLPGGVKFSPDKYFSGGDTVRTNSTLENKGDSDLYQCARFGNFTYVCKTIQPGLYRVDLHFAEMEFTEGPPGIRVFNVFMQEQKVISSLDIYERVGGNRPLVISDITVQVDGEEGLSIKFEGVTGHPIVCGIAVWKQFAADVEPLRVMGTSQMSECKPLQDFVIGEVNAEFLRLQIEHESQSKELIEAKQALKELKKENEMKSRECQEACRSLKELQNELMRKSMHVGSLAFAIEGQVKEKTRWFSSLRDLTRKLKILKMDQIELTKEALLYKQCLADVNDISLVLQSKIKEHLEIHEDLKTRFIKGAKERRELYNKVLELKGNIRVFCRCRPLNSEEVASGALMAIDFEAAKDGELTVKSNGLLKKTFKFDAVFSPQAGQDEVFEDTAPLATSVLDGYNVCIFAYGQTGTGKTFTMEGTDEARGVNYRTLEELFRIIEERKSTFRYGISVSVLEVYNEQIRDLLVSESQSGIPAKRLEVKQVGEGMHHVPGLIEAHVKNMKEVWEVLQTGSNGRAVGSTGANEHSSRSHCIHCVMVKGENLLNGDCTKSKLWLVDLAGSERIAKTEVQGERLKETQNINRSLSALGDVISALATKSPHIPFRNSKLTHLLQDSLGGDSKALMFVQISPNENDLSETLCSLNFASRVRGIELGLAKKQVENNELLKCKQMIEKSKQDMKNKDLQIKKLEDTIQGLDMRINEKDIKNKNLQDKIKELESQLLVERKLARQHVDTKIAEQLQHTRQQQEHNSAPLRPPLANRPIGLIRTFTDSEDQANIIRPVTDNNSKLSLAPTLDGFTNHNKLMEKENIPEMPEQWPLPKRTGRASICPGAQRIPTAQVPRRNSLIPLPTVPLTAQLPPLFPLTPIQAENTEDDDGVETNCLPEPSHWDSPREHKIGSKKLSSLLRKSLQKKVQMKSPLQQNIKRVGVNVGMEKVRVSIGSRGRMAHRVLSNARRVTKETLLKPSKREKERGWNVGTAARTIV